MNEEIKFESKIGMCFCSPPALFTLSNEIGIESKNYISKYCICGKLWEDHDGISNEYKIKMRNHYYD